MYILHALTIMLHLSYGTRNQNHVTRCSICFPGVLGIQRLQNQLAQTSTTAPSHKGQPRAALSCKHHPPSPHQSTPPQQATPGTNPAPYAAHPSPSWYDVRLTNLRYGILYALEHAGSRSVVELRMRKGWRGSFLFTDMGGCVSETFTRPHHDRQLCHPTS